MGSFLSYFPTPFPNEDFRSIFYRYHLNSFNPEIMDTNMELVGIRNNFTFFPKSLEQLMAKLPKTKHITIDSIILNNTLLPVLFPFISERYHPKLLKELEYGGSWEESSLGKLAGNKYGKNMSDLIKYCPSCIKEDIEKYGCSYIHRDHQFGFIHICNKHSDKLITQCAECGVPLDYSPLTEKCKNGHHNYFKQEIQNNKSGSVQKSILRDLEYILNNNCKINRQLVELRFLEHLHSKGYINQTTNSIMSKHLISDFKNNYSLDILEDFGVSYNHVKQHNTLENVFRGSKLVINLPLTLLFIRFLADSIENFLQTSIPYTCEVPFGNGPWRCENELCPKYEQNIIIQCERTYKAGLVKAKFSCGFCHTSYALNWRVSEFESTKKQTNRKKLEYQDIKMDQVLSLWEKGMPVDEIAKQAYCTPYIVKKLLKQKYKGCNLNQVNSFTEIAASFDDKLHITREKHRGRLLDILLNNEDTTRSEIREKCRASYTWLQQYDIQWLENKLPVSKTTGKLNNRKSFQINLEKYRLKLLDFLKDNKDLMRSEIRKNCKSSYDWLKKNDSAWLERLLPPSKSIDRFDWNEIDQNLAQRVKIVSSQLINSNPNTRVARYSIMGALTTRERGRIKTYIKHLPKTDQALNKCAETKEQYQLRHLPALVSQLRNHYGYTQVTVETIMSYRKSYRGIAEEMKDSLIEKLKKL
ncbi:TnsD family Tn7-like transposition protein [Sutcliffiella horikoshii]|uniref:TnsD family Tn7-like transposition protein n=1 Tax=Sutcliffiella horikoshii TaxID=79883 RepID=UPI00165343C2|nr:TnsD family Tn7-like transposition protein [Sutcliffiella horikoshii]